MSHGCAINLNTCTKAAEAGQLEVIKWLASKMDTWDEFCYRHSDRWVSSIVDAAALGGHLPVLEWIFQNVKIATIDATTVTNASQNGHLHVLKWFWEQDLLKMKSLFGDICKSAAKARHLDILVWAKQNGALFDSNTLFEAGRGGDIGIVQYILDSGEQLAGIILGSAAEGGHLDLMKWIHKSGVSDKFMWKRAAYAGQLHILKWIHENHFVWSKYWPSHYPSTNKDYLKAIQWALEIGDTLDGITCAKGAGNLEVLKLLRQNNCEWGDFMYAAVEAGNIDTVKWAFENGYSWKYKHDDQEQETVFYSIGKTGNLEFLELLFRNEAPPYRVYYEIASSAAAAGQLETLKFVLKQKAVCFDCLCVFEEIDAVRTSSWLLKQM